MQLLFIRHGEPDYVHDTLTEKGWREARLLAERIAPLDVKQYYVSPLGRAQDTARPTLERAGRTAVTLDWPAGIHRPGPQAQPARSGQHRLGLAAPGLDGGRALFQRPRLDPERDHGNGHRRDGLRRRHPPVRRPAGRTRLPARGPALPGRRSNHDTLVFFCHFALECVLLSRLINASPMVLWHGLCAAPSSVTTVATEERRPGAAYFRVLQFGDISHLYAHGEPTSFMARFRECASDPSVNET